MPWNSDKKSVFFWTECSYLCAQFEIIRRYSLITNLTIILIHRVRGCEPGRQLQGKPVNSHKKWYTFYALVYIHWYQHPYQWHSNCMFAGWKPVILCFLAQNVHFHKSIKIILITSVLLRPDYYQENDNYIVFISRNCVLNRFCGLKKQQPSYVYWTVHHCDSWKIKDQHDVTCYFISLLMCSTCFGH